MSRRDLATAALADAGIHRIAVPTPFVTLPTNAYLLDGDPLVLVDPGSNWATAVEALLVGLDELGHTLEEIGVIVLTHQHVDHEGLAGFVARRSGAEVACLDLLAPYLSDFGESMQRDFEVRNETMRRHGVSELVVPAVNSGADLIAQFGTSVTATRTVAPGGVLEVAGRRLRFLFRPGHSPSDTVIVDESHAVALIGDHLMTSGAANALVDRSLLPGQHRSRTRALVDYRASLRASRDLDVAVCAPGHGEAFLEPGPVIDARLARHERRMAQLRQLLGDIGPSSGHALARQIWGDVALSQTFLALSEVLGHLDLLLDEGEVVEHTVDGVTQFELA
jgi:glyoxylase-like metal-dependent hydrolase (beta-lactamase superfamily II)